MEHQFTQRTVVERISSGRGQRSWSRRVTGRQSVRGESSCSSPFHLHEQSHFKRRRLSAALFRRSCNCRTCFWCSPPPPPPPSSFPLSLFGLFFFPFCLFLSNDPVLFQATICLFPCFHLFFSLSLSLQCLCFAALCTHVCAPFLAH